MPTKKNRVNVVFDDDVFEVISTISKYRGISRSALIREFLLAAMPVMTKTAKMLELAHIATTSANADLDDLVKIIESAQGEIDGDFSELLAQVRKATSGVDK